MEEYKVFREYLRKMEVEMGLINKQEKCCGFDVSLAQCHALVEVGRSEKISLKELANMLRIDISTMSRTVDKIVKNGYVERKTSETDRRSVEIKLTKRGKELFDQIENSMNAKYKDIFDRISKDDRTNVLNSLEVIVKAFDCKQDDFSNIKSSENCCCKKK